MLVINGVDVTKTPVEGSIQDKKEKKDEPKKVDQPVPEKKPVAGFDEYRLLV